MMDLLSRIALTFTAGIGNNAIRRLVDLYPDEDIFALPPSELKAAFGSHQKIIEAVSGKSAFARAEEELRFCEDNHIRVLFFTDADYPARLNSDETADCPVLLYCLGTADFNPGRSISVVGTRKATAIGRNNTDRLVRELKTYGPHIVSGLAYGIDTAAHTAALEHGLPTVAVLGHGLDRIYPVANRQLAKRIIENGGALVTEYPSGTAINPRLFPARNRVIAAMSDATLVVEATEKGGALITAAIACSYHRDVFAVPGRLDDTYSKGTNNLIATNRALLARGARDIAFQLGWPIEGEQMAIGSMRDEEPLTADERKVVAVLADNDHLTLDEVATLAGFSLAKAAAALFNLELSNRIHTLPGHSYQLSRR
ncbi:MAG: DNA-processing protein DprA [Bacteroidales bacterium]|nr:DNA-processing protein DprA [Bacteroidales bacterium]